MAANPVILIVTPLGPSMVHTDYMLGMLQCHRDLAGLIHPLSPVLRHGLYVEINRDILTDLFIKTGATHMLHIDPDLCFTSDDVRALLDTNKDVICGTYCKRSPDRKLVGEFYGPFENDLQRAHVVPGGFTLVTRRAAMMVTAHCSDRTYIEPGHGLVTATWQSNIEYGKPHLRDDVAFSRNCTEAGIELWRHAGVVLEHYGMTAFVP